MVSFWCTKKDELGSPAHADEQNASSAEDQEPTEKTKLLPDSELGYLSPDDPAVSPYDLWSLRAIRAISVVALAITFIEWTFLLVSIFVSLPLMHSRGSGFFAFSYITLSI